MKRIIGIVLLIALIIGGVVAANIRSESQAQWEDMDITTQLQQGSLYGASRLLEAYGHDDVHAHLIAYSFNNKAIRYAHNSLLVVANTDSELSKTDADELLAWVERGNTAVIGLNDYSPFRSRLLEQLDVRITTNDKDDNESEQTNIAIADSCRQHEQHRQQQLRRVNETDDSHTDADDKHRRQRLQNCSRQLNTIRLPEAKTRPFVIYSDSDTHIQSKNNNNIWFSSQNHKGENGALLGLHHGKGRIIIAEEIDFFHNPRHPSYNAHTLTSHDHAAFLVHLAQRRDSVHLIGTWKPQGELLPAPTWLKLWRSQPIALSLLLATFIIGVWHLTSRTGSIRSLPPAPERSLNRHLLAQGRFFSQYFSRRAILQRLQQELLEEWHARHPAWKNMNSKQRLQLLARQTQLPPSQLKAWLMPLPEQISHAQWLQMLQSHRLIRRNSRNISR